MLEKIIGYFLLAFGVTIIFFSGYNVYQVFTKQAKPVQIFNFEGVSLDPNQMFAGLIPQSTNSAQPASIGKKTELISPAILNDTSNIFAHLMLMGFIASIGYKIASLGTKLVRPIVVRLRSKEITVENKPTA